MRASEGATEQKMHMARLLGWLLLLLPLFDLAMAMA